MNILPRLPFEPLAEICAARYRMPNDATLNGTHEHITDVGRVRDVLGVHSGVVLRWRDEGLTFRAADHAAAKLNLHPALIWLDWYEVTSAYHDGMEQRKIERRMNRRRSLDSAGQRA